MHVKSVRSVGKVSARALEMSVEVSARYNSSFRVFPIGASTEG
jgi:hypothetical protein